MLSGINIHWEHKNLVIEKHTKIFTKKTIFCIANTRISLSRTKINIHRQSKNNDQKVVLKKPAAITEEYGYPSAPQEVTSSSL